MKKLLFILLVSTALCISCSSDDENKEQLISYENLLGEWKVMDYDGSTSDHKIVKILFKENYVYQVFLSNNLSYRGIFRIDMQNENNVRCFQNEDDIIVFEEFEFNQFNGKKAKIKYSNTTNQIEYEFTAKKQKLAVPAK